MASKKRSVKGVSVRRFTLDSEVRRIAKRTLDPMDRSTLLWAAKELAAVRAWQKINDKEAADVSKLERLFGLEDPRG
jgi:hypothetical protein